MKTKSRSISKALSLISLITIWVSLSFSTTYAQRPGGSPEDRARHQTDMMKAELKLTPDQETKVYSINLKYGKKMQDLREVADTTERRKSFESMSKQKDTEMKGILTPDQFKSYQKYVADMKAKRQQGGPHN
jgi:Spy/CpxP family protein refolding chaperone